jgi:hypothetical protein
MRHERNSTASTVNASPLGSRPLTGAPSARPSACQVFSLVIVIVDRALLSDFMLADNQFLTAALDAVLTDRYPTLRRQRLVIFVTTLVRKSLC